MASSTIAGAPTPSTLSKFISGEINATTTTAGSLQQQQQSSFEHALALQVLHNLQYQHEWTALRLHTHSPLPPYAPLPRPLLSGLPPRRLYIHPDEQIELLKEAKKRQKSNSGSGTDNKGKTGAAASTATTTAALSLQAEPEREWVLPTRLNEKWSLEKTADVMDRINLVPADTESGDAGDDDDDDDDGGQQQDEKKDEQHLLSSHSPNKWRTTKRVLMAIADHDSTIVYYIVHDGIVKPRQN